MIRRIFVLVAIVSMFLSQGLASAYVLPKDDCGAKYFYLFGPDGNPLYGARKDFQQEIYIYMPKDETSNLSVYIYDPETSDFRDFRENPENEWDTVTEFAIYGKGNALLAKQEFGSTAEYDRSYYKLGEFNKEEGEPAGDFYKFKFVAKGIKGDDANLFRVEIYPYSAESFTYDVTLRLLEQRGSKMYLYPEIPEGTKNVIIENYDVDPDGGISQLRDVWLGRATYYIKDSDSGKWAETVVTFDEAQQPRRLEYIITKGTQKYAHAGFRVRDINGNLLPMYFRKGKPLYIAPKLKFVPPVAKLEQEPVGLKCNEFTFDASSSYGMANQKLLYTWDFGDGTTSNEQIVAHKYTKAGEYSVTLTVKDDSGLDCNTAVTKQTVKVNMPPVAAFTAPDKACLGSDVKFDASATKDDPSDNLTYKWDFGDRTTAEGVTFNKKYSKLGSYNVTLTVDDNNSTPCSVVKISRPIKINAGPKAYAGNDIDKCFENDEECIVDFDAGKSSDADNDTLSYIWDFGDGTTESGKVVSHTYKKGGTYNVKLAVDDSQGLQCSSDVDNITVKLNKRPVADAGLNLVCCVETESYFDGSKSYDADGDNLLYEWDFGDGTTATGQKVSHIYTKSGVYKVTLVVNDNKDTEVSLSNSSFTVTVHEKPVPIIKIR